MALIVQDDTGLIEDANSYVTLLEYKTYWSTRNIDLTTVDDKQLEADLITAREYADELHDYCGSKLNGRAQTTEFPRVNFYEDDCSTLIEGVPVEMKNAQMEYAKLISVDGITLQPNENVGGSVKRTKEKVDVLEEEIEYFSAGQTGGVISYPVADKKIPEYFYCNGGGGLTLNHA